MATLTGKQIANTYKDLLQVSNANSGIDATVRTVSDGEGTESALQISNAAVNINGTFQLNGESITKSAAQINNIADLTGKTGLLAGDGSNVFGRTLVAGQHITIGNADGQSGNPTIAVSLANTSITVSAVNAATGTFSGIVSAAGFAGPITGDVTGNVTGTAINAVTGDFSTKVSSAKVNGTNATFSNIVSATTFDGNLIGNVTGNVTGDLTGDVDGVNGAFSTQLSATTVIGNIGQFNAKVSSALVNATYISATDFFAGTLNFTSVSVSAYTTNTLRVLAATSLDGTLDVGGNAVFDSDVTFTGASYNAVWDKSDNALEFADNGKATFGDNGDLAIWHDGSSTSYLQSTAGNLYITATGTNSIIMQAKSGENSIIATGDGAVTLYHDHNSKFATTPTGINVTGNVTATAFYGDGANLTNVVAATSVSAFTINQLAVVSSAIFSCTVSATAYYGDGSNLTNLPSAPVSVSAYTVNQLTVVSAANITTGSAGSVTASTDADELVLESSGNTGMSLLAAASGNAQIYFGEGTDNDAAFIQYNGSIDDLILSTTNSGSQIIFKTDTGTAALTLDNSQNATFAGDIQMSGASGSINFTDSSKGLYYDGNELVMFTTGADDFITLNGETYVNFKVNSLDLMRLLPTGLHIGGTAALANETILQVTNSGDTSTIGTATLALNNTNTTAGAGSAILFSSVEDTGANRRGVIEVISEGTQGGAMKFSTRDSVGAGSAWDEDTLILTGGNATFAGAVKLEKDTSAGASPITLELRATENSASWSTTADYAQLQFYSADASSPAGASVRASWGARMTGSTGGSSYLVGRVGGTDVLTLANTGDGTFSGNVAINTTLPTTAGSTGQLLIGDSGGIVTFDGETNYSQNVYYDSQWKYRTTDTASILQMGNSDIPFRFSYAASGSADAAASFTEAMQINGDGHVGIGAAPNATFGSTLYVQDTPTANKPIIGAYSQGNSNTAGIGLFNDSGNRGIWTTGSVMRFTQTYEGNSTDHLVIDASGLVGFGTASPSEELHIFAAAPTIKLEDSDNNLSGYINGDSGNVLLQSHNVNRDIIFGENAASGEFARIVGVGGKVGIGISAPDGKLHVHNATAGSVTANANADDLVIESDGFTGLSILTPNDQLASIVFGDPDDNDVAGINYDHGGNSMRFVTNAAERVRIGSAGQIGIGGANYGTDGQILTSQGSGAAAQWEDAAGGGSLSLLATTTASSSDDLEITGLSASKTYLVIIQNLVPSSTTANVQMFWGSSSAYKTDGADGGIIGMDGYGNTYDKTCSDGGYEISNRDHNVANSRPYNGTFTLDMGGSGDAGVPMLYGECTYNDSVGGASVCGTVYLNISNGYSSVDRLKVQMSNSTIASGRLTVWEVTNA